MIHISKALRGAILVHIKYIRERQKKEKRTKKTKRQERTQGTQNPQEHSTSQATPKQTQKNPPPNTTTAKSSATAHELCLSRLATQYQQGHNNYQTNPHPTRTKPMKLALLLVNLAFPSPIGFYESP
jgi:hypothetical protein